jgi:CRISPR-associated protein Cas1
MLTGEVGRTSSVAASEDVVTGDMLAQLAYCPRRLHILYAEGRWADNVHTDAGRWEHRNADRREDALPNADDPDRPRVQRSITLESPARGLRVKLDLLEADGTGSIPIEQKHGEGPSDGGVWPPERLQVGAQALLLRDHGHACDHGIVYYAASRRRVRVALDAALEEDVTTSARAVLSVLASTESPPPLVDSPKCPGCSVSGLCLPDETNLLRGEPRAESVRDDEPVRRLVPPRDDALPFYVQEQGAQVGKRGESLVITQRGATLADVRLLDVSQLVLCGAVSVTHAALHLLCEAGVPVVHLSMGHWFYGITHGMTLRNAFDRAAQFVATADPVRALALARAFVTAKARNQRTLLRRNGPSDALVLDALRVAVAAIDDATSVPTLLGAEGHVAALYFGAFATMLRPREPDGGLGAFDFSGRNRRPPRDPVNAMLSFGYALLAKDATVALLAAGLDPWWGVYHRPRHGRPALALDLMEELRPLIVDSAVITAVNTGAVDAGCFERSAAGCALNARGRKAFLRVYEARMDQLVTHPVFDYRVSWRRMLAVQALLLARVFRGSLADYPAIVTR